MKVGILMFDKINLLSFAKIYDFLHKFEDFNIKTYALKPEIVDEFGIRLHPEIYKALELGGLNGLHFRQNSQTGQITASASKRAIKLNEALH